MIRQRDADENGMVKCISCPKVQHWTEMDAGHFFAQSVSLKLTFNEKNVHAQCKGCNSYGNGNLPAYMIELRKRYGPDIVEELMSLREEGFRYTRNDYEELIDKYSGF